MPNYNRYFAVKEVFERCQDDILPDLREVSKRYLQLKNNGRYSPNRFPDHVEEIERYRDHIAIRGTSSCRGCTDHESCSIPLDLILASPDEREAYFARMGAQNKTDEDKQKAQIEVEERALLGTLLSRYGGIK